MATEEVLKFEVKSNVASISKDMKKLSENTEEATKEQKALNSSTSIAAVGFKRLRGMVAALGTALKALGIGLLISAFVALQEALGRNQKIMDQVNTIMTTVSITFNQIVNSLINTFNWITKTSDRFNGLSKVIQGLLKIAIYPLKLSFFQIKLAVQAAQLAWEDSFLGGGDAEKISELRQGITETTKDITNLTKETIKAGSDVVTNFADAVSEVGAIYTVTAESLSKISIKGNKELAESTTAAQNSSKLAEAQIQGLIEKNDLLAEKQRQIRDDETKTFAERIAANEELGKVLDDQEVEMLKLADKRVAAAALELSANKKNIDLQVAYQQTLNDRAGVEAQVAGFRSEQLTNEVSLNKEQLEIQNELRAEGLSGIERELEELENAYNLKLDMARKSGDDITAITEQYEKQKEAVVQSGVNAQLSAYSALTGALGKLAGENKQFALAQAIIDTYAAANSVLNDDSYIGPTRFIAAAAAIATGLANVQSIMNTQVPGGGGGGGGGGGSVPSVGATQPAPQMMSGSFELSNTAPPEPMQAFVVSDDITNNQDKLAAIRRRATI